MNRSPNKRKPSPTQSAAQQAVLNKLRSGGTIQGAQPNNPLAYAAQFFDPRRFFNFSKPSSIPTLKGGMVNGREALIAPGGWNQDTAGLGEITVGGQRFFPAQSGKDLVYQRAPGQIGGQYGSIRVPNQLASSSGEVASTPADRAYQSAKAETAAMVATDPLMQQWSDAQKAKDFTTADQLGKQIWQNRYGKTEMGRPGGVIGSRNPLMDSTFDYQTGMSPGDIAKTITNPSDIPVSPGEAPYQIGDFGTRVGENGYDAASYGITPEMIEEIRKRQGVEEMKNRLLQQASTK
jgi:hypothetical protein